MLGGAELVEQSKNVHMNGLKVKILCVPTNCPQKKNSLPPNENKSVVYETTFTFIWKNRLLEFEPFLCHSSNTRWIRRFIYWKSVIWGASVCLLYIFFSVLLPLAPQSFSRLFISLPLRVLDVNQFNNRARTSLCPIIQWISKTMGHQRQEKRHLFSFFISYL